MARHGTLARNDCRASKVVGPSCGIRCVNSEPVSLTDSDIAHLERCVELAREALENGDEPFGSILVDADGVREYLLGDRTILGRDRAADICLRGPGNAGVGRRHAAIERRGLVFTIYDAGSTFGVAIGGVRVEMHVLRAGDVVQLGEVRCEFLADPPVDPAMAERTRRVSGATMAALANFFRQVLPVVDLVIRRNDTITRIRQGERETHR